LNNFKLLDLTISGTSAYWKS